jgi:pyruvate dehydrogenase E2 component (dihydrolipoamide acetyltransferase)
VATEVTIPNLGYTMRVAKIIKWLKSVGDPIEANETLFEIETDKVAYGIESPVAGFVRAILANVGDEVPVGNIVAILGGVDDKIDFDLYRKREDEMPPSQSKQAVVQRESISVTSQPLPTGSPALASPVAKKMAKGKGIDLSLVKGSGRSGRIRMSDVERYLRDFLPVRGEVTPSSGLSDVVEIIPISTMRRTIAQRLSQSSHDAPHVYLCVDVDMTESKKLHEYLSNKVEVKTQVRLSLNDIFIKAAAVTLRDHPRLNARLQGDHIELLRSINIGLAVALPDGLIVPAIERADQKRLWQIAQERKDLVERARQGSLSLVEMGRGTFTISNLGIYDIRFFTSILNPPQAGILSIGKIFDKPVARNGAIVIRPIVEIILAIDHRIVDGALGAQCLQDFKNSLEDPNLLI